MGGFSRWAQFFDSIRASRDHLTQLGAPPKAKLESLHRRKTDRPYSLSRFASTQPTSGRATNYCPQATCPIARRSLLTDRRNIHGVVLILRSSPFSSVAKTDTTESARVPSSYSCPAPSSLGDCKRNAGALPESIAGSNKETILGKVLVRSRSPREKAMRDTE